MRGASERLIRSHQERIREDIHTPRVIKEDELESFIADMERRAAEYLISRNVWVQMSDRALERLQGGKPRDKFWRLAQHAIGWLVAVGVSLVRTVGGMRGCADLSGFGGDTTEVWSDEIRIVLLVRR